jgi:hypothetical protein
MKKKNGLLQNIFLQFFENSSDELGTGILVTFENQSSIIYWFLLRYTAIIYKFTQGNLEAKKIARSRFQSPAKKKNRKLRHWRPTARSLLVPSIHHHLIKMWLFFYRKKCHLFLPWFSCSCQQSHTLVSDCQCILFRYTGFN